MRCGWIQVGMVLAAAPLGAAEPGGAAAPEQPAPPRPAAEKQTATRKASSPEKPDLLMEDPLQREKLSRDLWITKGILGGFKADDLWILQPLGGGSSAPAASRDGDDAASKAWPDWRDRWSGALDGAERGAAAQADLDQAERLRHWEKFVFGDKDKAKAKLDEKNKASDPFDASWRRPLLSQDNGPAETVVKPAAAGGLTLMPNTSHGATFQAPANGLSDFGLRQTPIVRDERQPVVSDAARAAGMPVIGPEARAPGLSFEPLGPSSRVSGWEQSRPGAPSPFRLQPPGMPSLGLPDNPAFGTPKGPEPAARAHSTDSFLPPRQW